LADAKISVDNFVQNLLVRAVQQTQVYIFFQKFNPPFLK